MTEALPTEDVSPEKKIERDALEYFTQYFVQNYPGPNTIISNPRWHAPKIFRAAVWALKQAKIDAEDSTQPDDEEALRRG